MDHFARRHGVLYAEDVALRDVAERFGTPTYVYARATIERHVRVLQAGLQNLPHLICYAVKANSNCAILDVLAGLGCGFDAVSLGELLRLSHLGVDPKGVIVSGVGKSNDEITAALQAGVCYICVESAEELRAVGDIACTLGVQARVAVRVNPDVDAKTHPYISTGLKENKFGVPMAEAPELYRSVLQHPHVKMVGASCHIGSQITTLAPFEDAAKRMVALVEVLRGMGVALQHVGLGGGLGVPYHGESPPEPSQYGATLARILGPLGLHLVLEPGRVIVGNAGVLLTRVVRRKAGTDRDFVLVDAGMNDLMRPALYDAYHHIEPVEAPRGAEVEVDVVGPVCESADTFAKQRLLPPLKTGDLLAIRTAGAYGFVMASQYNSRRLPAEVMCDKNRMLLARKRDAWDDLWRGEHRLDGSQCGPFNDHFNLQDLP